MFVPDTRISLLQRLTADDTWWADAGRTLLELSNDSSEARSSLSDEISSASSVRVRPSKLAGQTADIVQQEHWVLALLQSTDDTSLLGRLDGLDVEAVIGQGGMGVVLKARDSIDSGREFATCHRSGWPIAARTQSVDRTTSR